MSHRKQDVTCKFFIISNERKWKWVTHWNQKSKIGRTDKNTLFNCVLSTRGNLHSKKTWIEIKGLKKVYTMQKSHIKIRQNRTCDWSYLKQWKTVKKVNPFGKKVTIINIHTLNSRTTKYTKQNWYNWNDKWIIQK